MLVVLLEVFALPPAVLSMIFVAAGCCVVLVSLLASSELTAPLLLLAPSELAAPALLLAPSDLAAAHWSLIAFVPL